MRFTQEDQRGRELDDWIATLNLCIINVGKTPTCVRQRASSFVDVTLTTNKIAARIKK